LLLVLLESTLIVVVGALRRAIKNKWRVQSCGCTRLHKIVLSEPGGPGFHLRSGSSQSTVVASYKLVVRRVLIATCVRYLPFSQHALRLIVITAIDFSESRPGEPVCAPATDRPPPGTTSHFLCFSEASRHQFLPGIRIRPFCKWPKRRGLSTQTSTAKIAQQQHYLRDHGRIRSRFSIVPCGRLPQ
jgi:hypothetical protein